MTATRPIDNLGPTRIILLIGAGSIATYAVLAWVGELRAHPILHLAAHTLLTAAMIAVWRLARNDRFRAAGWILGASLIFRLVAATGAPALSDDIYRYVWDGRVQVGGTHPYLHAPDAPELEPLRTEDWERINHPSIRTIYPPTAQMFFTVLAGVGMGTTGFKLMLGLVDFGVVLLLLALLRQKGIPESRVIFYAWNPVAVLETAGSGHLEPVGIALVITAILALGSRRRIGAGVSLAAAIQVKLVPIVLLPGLIRSLGLRGGFALVLASFALIAPYALTGPSIGGGLAEYAERWEYNAPVFSVVRETLEALDSGERLKQLVSWMHARIDSDHVPWDLLYRRVWPPYTARGIVAVAAMLWIGWLAVRRRPETVDGVFLVLTGVVILSPTVHPWYLLWVLPFAAAVCSWPWLLLTALIPLAYLSGPDADVGWAIRALEYVPPLVLAIALGNRRERFPRSYDPE